MIQVQTFKGPGSLESLQAEVPFEQHSVRVYGKVHPQPRLVKWYGQVAYRYSGLTLAAGPMPPLLEAIRFQLEIQLGHSLNSVLCNLYRDGNDHVGWHADDEAIFGGDPVVVSVSFGSARVFKLRKKADHKQQESCLLLDRSLLVMGKGVQPHWQHTVPKTKIPGARINLTFRQTV